MPQSIYQRQSARSHTIEDISSRPISTQVLLLKYLRTDAYYYYSTCVLMGPQHRRINMDGIKEDGQAAHLIMMMMVMTTYRSLIPKKRILALCNLWHLRTTYSFWHLFQATRIYFQIERSNCKVSLLSWFKVTSWWKFVLLSAIVCTGSINLRSM